MDIKKLELSKAGFSYFVSFRMDNIYVAAYIADMFRGHFIIRKLNITTRKSHFLYYP